MSMQSTTSPQKISEVIDEIRNKLQDQDQEISIKEIYHSFGRRTYGPFLFIIGLTALSPIGAIPGMGILSGTMTFLIVIQFFFLSTPWLPEKILAISFSESTVRNSLDKTSPYIKKIESYVKPRFSFLTKFPMNYFAIVMVILVSLSMILLALIPWRMTFPAMAIMLVGIAIISRDGLLLLAGYIFCLGSFLCVYYFT
ncbi:MAG: exopolysaccharide biosynthesis protein [Chlamydiales bacterium]